MSDPFYKPRRTPDPPRKPKPGERLFEFYREHDHSRWLCELRKGDDGKFHLKVDGEYPTGENYAGDQFSEQALEHRWPSSRSLQSASSSASPLDLHVGVMKAFLLAETKSIEKYSPTPSSPRNT